MAGTHVGVREAKATLSRLLNLAAFGGERIIIESRGQPKGALISYEDLQRFEQLEEELESKLLAGAIATETEFYSAEEVDAELFALESTE